MTDVQPPNYTHLPLQKRRWLWWLLISMLVVGFVAAISYSALVEVIASLEAPEPYTRAHDRDPSSD